MPKTEIPDADKQEANGGFRRILLKLSGEALAGTKGDQKFWYRRSNT